MDKTVTEKDYPIRGVWIIKSTLGGILSSLIFTMVVSASLDYSVIKGVSSAPDIYIIPILLSMVMLFLFAFSVLPLLQRATFHYAVEDKFITLKQGIISREQRHIPYDVVQDILIKQDLLDRLFGIGTLIVENAAQGGNDAAGRQSYYAGGRSQRRHGVRSIGFSGNKVYIPGLTIDDTESLKGIILQKALENPGRHDQSGL